jgi:hypothetical protein
MKKLLYTLRIGLLYALFPLAASAQIGQRSYNTTTAVPDVGISNIGSGIAFHVLSWNPLATVSACSVKLQQSPDNAAWVDLIGSQTCTSAGQSAVTNVVANYIRIDPTTLTVSGGGRVVFHWDGYNSSPSGGGTVTGTGASPEVAFWSSPNALTGSTNFTYTTGQLRLISPAVGTTPLVVNSFSASQTAGLADFNNNSTAGATIFGTVTARGAGVGNFGSLFASVQNSEASYAYSTFNVLAPANYGYVERLRNDGTYEVSAFNGTSVQGFFFQPTTAVVPGILAGSVSVQYGAASDGLVLGIPGQTSAILTFLGNAGGKAIIGVAAAAGTPAKINLPQVTGTVGQILSTDGGTPQQTSWITSNTTATNCAANGTAANPSVVSCVAAAAGMFSCATAASTGTCRVNTTAVTANSEIFVTQDAADGGAGQLNVTCNTGNDLSASAPLLASKSTGASFTINLGVVGTNPACFEYYIVN